MNTRVRALSVLVAVALLGPTASPADAAPKEEGIRVRVLMGHDVPVPGLTFNASRIKGPRVEEDDWTVTVRADEQLRTYPLPGAFFRGRVVASDDDTITIESRHRRLTVPREAIRRLESVQGREPKGRHGLVIGSIVGGLATAAALSGSSCDGEGCMFVQLVMPLGAGLGAAVGYALGSSVHGDRWAPADPHTITITPIAAKHAVGVRVALTF